MKVKYDTFLRRLKTSKKKKCSKTFENSFKGGEHSKAFYWAFQSHFLGLEIIE